MAEILPARTIRPQAIVRRELEARQWTTEELADLTHYPASFWDEWLSDDSYGMDDNLAARLGASFGTSLDFWVNVGKGKGG